MKSSLRGAAAVVALWCLSVSAWAQGGFGLSDPLPFAEVDSDGLFRLETDGEGTWIVTFTELDESSNLWSTHYLRSEDNGRTWEGPILFDPDGDAATTSHLFHDIAFSGGRWFWFFSAGDMDGNLNGLEGELLQFSISEDGGQTWERSQNFDPSNTIFVAYGLMRDIEVAPDGDLIVTYTEIHGEVAFITGIRVSPDTPLALNAHYGLPFSPQPRTESGAKVVVSDGDVGVIAWWRSNSTLMLQLSMDLWVGRLVPQGGTFPRLEDMQVLASSTLEFGAYPQEQALATDGEGMWLIAWGSPEGDTLLARSRDNGATWSGPLTVLPQARYKIEINSHSDDLWIITAAGNDEAAAGKTATVSLDNGSTWSEPFPLLTTPREPQPSLLFGPMVRANPDRRALAIWLERVQEEDPLTALFATSDTFPFIQSNGTGGGFFGEGSTWIGGREPASPELALIAEGDTVFTGGDVALTALTISPGATLSSDSLSLNILNGGRLEQRGTLDAERATVAFLGSGEIRGDLHVDDLLIGPGGLLTERGQGTVRRQLTNLGTIRNAQPIAGSGEVAFGLTGVTATVADPGSLEFIQIDRIDADSPFALAPAWMTGVHWNILASPEGYAIDLTLPHDGLANPLVSLFDGERWQSGRTALTATTVTLAGLTALTHAAVALPMSTVGLMLTGGVVSGE